MIDRNALVLEENLQLANQFSQSDPDKCLSLCEEILSCKSEDLYGSPELQALFLKTRSLWLKGHHPEAMMASEALLSLAEKKHLPLFKSKALNIQGNIHYELRHYEEALNRYLKALSWVESDSLPSHMGAALLNNIGEVHKASGDSAKALVSYEQAYEIATGLEDQNLAGIITLNKGEVLSIKGDYEKALELVTESADLFKKCGDFYNLAESHFILGDIYFKCGRFPEAEEVYLKSYNLAVESSDNDLYRIKALIRLGNLCLHAECYERALPFATRARDLAKAGNFPPLESEAAHLQSILNEKTGDLKGALEALKGYIALQNQLYESTYANMQNSLKTHFRLHQLETERAINKQRTHELEEKNSQLTILSKELEELKNMFQELSLKDSLTGIPNRRHFYTVFSQELKRAKRDKTPLSLIVLDVDYFKEYNDYYGHLSGDRCLMRIAGTLEDCLRRSVDLLARFGGDEFVLLLPNTNKAGAGILLEKLHEAVHTMRIDHLSAPHSAFVTLSAGCITLVPEEEDTVDSLFQWADEALYKAKSKGRDIFHLESRIPGYRQSSFLR